MKFIAVMWLIAEACFVESKEFIGLVPFVLDDAACHGAATTLGIDRNHLHAVASLHVEQRLNNLYFAANALPIEEMFIFLGSQMYQHPVIFLDGFDERICKA